MEWLVWPTVFLAAASAVVACGRGLAALAESHPDLVDELRSGRSRRGQAERLWRLAVGLAAREAPTSRLAGWRRRIARDLRRAAAPEARDPDRFAARLLVEGVAVAAGAWLLLLLVGGSSHLLLALALGTAHALLLRPQLLRSRAEERVAEIDRRLPYAIDLIVLVLTAGGTLREALELIARRADRDPLAAELATALAEMDAGAPRARALADLAERVRLDDLSNLVLAIERGEETGAPMARALATQAEIYRFRRLQRAERLAVEAPVKMMFPNMLIMLAVLLIVLGPVFIQIVSQGLF